MTFEYDSVGNRKKRTDYAGRITNYTYDNLNRLTKIEYGDPVAAGAPPNAEATYAYDDISRLTAAVNEAGTVGFTYDNRNRLKTENDVFGQVLEFGYDAASNRTQLKLNGSVHTSYTYDDANRLTTLTDEASQNFTFGYDIADRMTSRTMPNGVTSTFEYDGMSRLKRLKHQSSTATLFDNQYAYNSANQISQITDLANTRLFGYDLVDRLTSVHTNGTQTESYTFDDVGNRTASHLSATYGYQSGKFNQLASTATATMQYDANGNIIRKGEGSQFWRYVWDQENRLTEAATRKQKVRYKYDAVGRRVERNFGFKERTKFTNDGLDVVMDDDAATGITKYQNGLGIDDKLKVSSSAASSYFLQDHLGSTLGLANSSATVTSSSSYDSFGNPTGNLASRYQFTGREFDNFTGLQFSRARFYAPALGRFISEDPIGFGGGDVNLYVYVRNSPSGFKDPSGLDIFGISYGVSGVAGVQTGVAGSLSQLYGYNSSARTWGDAIGGATSYGVYGTASCRSRTGAVFGLSGGGGVAGVWSNAQKWDELQGDFDSHIASAGPVQIQFDIGTGPNGPVFVIQLGTTKSWGQPVSYSNYTTTTPKRGIFTVNSIGTDVRNGWYQLNRDIRGLYENSCGCR